MKLAHNITDVLGEWSSGPPAMPSATRTHSKSGSRRSQHSNNSSPNNRSHSGRSESNTNPSLYKTELSRSFFESGYCRYGLQDLRPIMRHRKYETEVCKNYAKDGTCPYGPRCRFRHGSQDSGNNSLKTTPLSSPFHQPVLSSSSPAVRVNGVPAASPPVLHIGSNSNAEALQLAEITPTAPTAPTAPVWLSSSFSNHGSPSASPAKTRGMNFAARSRNASRPAR